MDLDRRVAFTAAAALATAALVPTLADAAVMHGRMYAALNALDNAVAELRAAAHDFGGHRADALAACTQARDQLKIALDWAKQHNV
jgi:hypothetical protein